jgi:hypothetical protein
MPAEFTMKNQLWIGWILIIISGCAKPERDFTADVFIRTQGGESVKCGLVTVSAFDEKVITTWRTEILKTTSSQASDLQTRLNNANAKLKIATEEQVAASSKVVDLSADLHEPLPPILPGLRTEPGNPAAFWGPNYKEIWANGGYSDDEKRQMQSEMDQYKRDLAQYKQELAQYHAQDQANMDAYTKAKETFDLSNEVVTAARAVLQSKTEAVEAAQQDLSNLKDEYARWPQTARAIIFRSLPLPVTTAKTDADGKCSGKVPKPGKYAIAAEFHRIVGETGEDTLWLIWVNFNDKNTKRIMLSNDNTIDTVEDSESVLRFPTLY